MNLQQIQLYGILDTAYSNPSQWIDMARKMIFGGVQIIQIRAKMKSEQEIFQYTKPIVSLFKQNNIPFIINDFPRLVPQLEAYGCHVGQDDMTIAEARKLAGKNVIIGKSTHSLKQALAAEQEGADYIGVGPIFSTNTKPDYQPVGLSLIKQVAENVKIPQFCIGGIKLENLHDVSNAGGQRVVIVSGILQARDPVQYAKKVRQHLDGLTHSDKSSVIDSSHTKSG